MSYIAILMSFTAISPPIGHDSKIGIFVANIIGI
jgi:hypothetical protein